MLLVAIPKSASTAVMQTFAEAHDLPCDMHYRWRAPRTDAVSAYHRQHNFGWELTQQAVEDLTAPGILHKAHIVPSDHNLAMLAGTHLAVLLRDPAEIVQAYRRGHETGIYPQKTDMFAGCRTAQEWHTRAEETGILADLRFFHDRWAARPALQLRKAEVDDDWPAVFSRMCSHFGVPDIPAPPLLRRKWTRDGSAGRDRHVAQEQRDRQWRAEMRTEPDDDAPQR